MNKNKGEMKKKKLLSHLIQHFILPFFLKMENSCLLCVSKRQASHLCVACRCICSGHRVTGSLHSVGQEKDPLQPVCEWRN